jgi:hypothetical protein
LTPRYSTKASLCPIVHFVRRASPLARVPRRRPGFTDTVPVLLPDSIADRPPLLHSPDPPGGSLRWLSREPSLPLDAHAPPPRAPMPGRSRSSLRRIDSAAVSPSMASCLISSRGGEGTRRGQVVSFGACPLSCCRWRRRFAQG